MSFLNPVPALVAAAVAVPLLLLLYVLKLRRQTMRIASTLLWRASTQDLQANTPFQRLRWSLLLLLQLLIVAALLAALARPVLYADAPGSSRLILLIDQSASMSAREAEGRSRLDDAKDAAREIVQRLGRRSEAGEMMVVAFAASAHVITGFQSDRRVLLDAIDSIESTDEQADLDEALALAGAFASRDEAADQALPAVVLISDGGVGPSAEAGGFSLRAGDFRFIGVGPPPEQPVDNVGIATFSARRDYQDPARVLVFARLVNAGPQSIDTTATLRVGDDPVETKRVQLPAAGEHGVGEVSVSFDLPLTSAAVLTLACGHRDALSADDVAALVVMPPTSPRIALVHPGDGPDPFLHDLVEALQPQRLAVQAARPGDAQDGRQRWVPGEFDLVIFDRAAPQRLPDVSTLSFGAAPAGVALRPPSRTGGQRILSWDRQHPLLRHVSLDALVYSGFGGYDLPQGSTPLAFGPDGPVIALLEARGARHVLVGFSLRQSNWPMHVSITVFVQNALDFLTLAGDGGTSLAVQPGRPITVRAQPEAVKLSIEGPVNATVDVAPGSQATLPVLRRVGLYTVRGAEPPMDQIAVNMLSDVESDIRPRRSLVVNAEVAQAGAARAAAPLELWPWLAAVAMGLLTVEWLVYCARMRG